MWDLTSFSATDAQKFLEQYYVAADIVVTLVGEVKASESMPIIEKYFSRLPTRPAPDESTTTEPPQKSERRVGLHQQSQPIYLEGHHPPDSYSPDDAGDEAITHLIFSGGASPPSPPP